MARISVLTVLIACGLVAALSSAVLSFVGLPGASPSLRSTGQRDVSMQFGGGEPATTTPPPQASVLGDLEPGTYIIGMSLFMIASVVANAGGFFGPWAK